MSYNIEDNEDFLKNESPYNMSDDKWEAMQQRIRKNALAAISETAPPKTKKFNYWKTTTAAAIIGIMVASAIYFNAGKQSTQPSSNLAVNQSPKTINPEMQLDNAISNLNEEELNLSHQLSENEISEQNEYFED